MGKQLLSIPSFTAGEMSSSMQGRTDFQKYFNAATRIENFVVLPHGPVTRRPGTYFTAEVKSSSTKTRLIPFSFSTTQTYILELGNQYMRFYKDNGQIQSGSSAYEISTPYLTSELFNIKFAQSADVMYLCHENHPVRKLSRTGHTSWTLTEIEFIDGPYLDLNLSDTTLTPSALTGSITITASATAGINGGSGFLSTDVDRLISLKDGYVKITAVGSTTSVTATVQIDLDNTTATKDWSLGSFSNTTGHPSVVSFFEQRLVFAGTTNNPQTMFFSKSGDYENMTSGTADDAAMVYTIASNQVNAIQAMKATRTLIVMTTGGEYAVSAGSGIAITPTNISIVKQSNYGSSNVDALSIGNATIFLQRARRKIRELAYNFDSDGYVAPDLTILADHISETGILQMDYQQEPYSVVWGVRTDGVLVGLTYNRLENVVAWHRHIIGGKSDTGKTIKQQKISFAGNTTTVSNNQITLTGHGLSTGDQVYYFCPAGTNKIGGLSNSKVYYVIRVDANTIKLANSSSGASAGTAISLTVGLQTVNNTHFIYQGVNINNNFLFVSNHGFKTGDHIFYKKAGTAISGLLENTKYFVSKIDDNQIQLFTDETRNKVVNLTSAHTSEQIDKILTHAKVESVAVIDGDTDEDQVYLIVQRYINGATKRYVEYFTPFEFNNDLTAFHYMDSGLTYSGGETATLSGLNHLEGEIVSIIGEGSVQNSKLVSSGGISLDTAIEEATVGLLYSSDLQTMRLDEGYTETTQTKTKRVYDLSVRFLDTIGASVGPDADTLTSIDFRDSSANMDLPVPLFTGDKSIEFDVGHGTEGLIYIKQPQALPMTILGIYPRLETESV